MSDVHTVRERLERFLGEQPDAGTGRVSALSRAGSGRSRDNWLFDLDRGADAPPEPLILRTDPAGGLIDTDRGVEFTVLQHLEKSTLPTPGARWLDRTGSVFGRPSLIMRRLPGTCEYRVLRDPARPLAERVGLARTFAELLAEVHAVDWRLTGLDAVLPDPGTEAARAELAHWAAVLRTDQLEPWPELEYAIAALGETAPPAARTALVHADFKPGNILLDGTHVTALLDWELAHLGDPVEDLGWVTQPLRAGEHTIDGAWEAADLVAHYEQASGAPVDRTALAWWVTFSTFKTAVMQVSGLNAFLDGRADEPYRPTRRVLATLLEDLS
jgi:aminoglycoside phosphotransferase (APT) family kinase protein